MHTIIEHNKKVSHLVIPDYHTYKGDDLRRFKALGKLIALRQPEVIVFMGDMCDMGSLCKYDEGKKSFVFENVKDDIEALHTAEKEIYRELITLNSGLAKAKKKQYSPKVIKLLGNHEYRLQRLLDYEPKWEGTYSMNSFATRYDVDETIIPFKDFIEVDGVFYSHFWASGVMGRPFASARAMIQKRGVSCTMGDTHTLDIATLTKPDGSRIRGLVAGSFHDPDYKSFAGPQVDKIWFNGVIYKHDVYEGNYDIEELNVERLLEM